MKTATLVVCIASFFTILPRGSAAPRNSSEEHIEFALGKEWKVVQNAQTRTYTILEFVRNGDTIDTWNELVTVQNFRKSHAYRSPVETFNELKATREKECPGVTQWNVIDSTERSIVYEWHAKNCLGQPEQHELARILYGEHNVFFLHYAAKVHELKLDTRAEWIKKLQAVSINSEPTPAVPNGDSRDKTR